MLFLQLPLRKKRQRVILGNFHFFVFFFRRDFEKCSTDPTLEPDFDMKELSYTSESARNRFFRHFSIRVDPATFCQAPSLDSRWGVQKFWILQGSYPPQLFPRTLTDSFVMFAFSSHFVVSNDIRNITILLFESLMTNWRISVYQQNIAGQERVHTLNAMVEYGRISSDPWTK